MLNTRLADARNISQENREKINALHISRKKLYKCIEELSEYELKALGKAYAGISRELEFMLQDLWGFDRDITKHRFWELPRCECSKLDNKERYGTPYQIINRDCPLHGQ